MAAGTSWFGWAECTSDMATFAGYVYMRAVEHKAGTKVIERLLRPGIA